jgi:hypothetical protein
MPKTKKTHEKKHSNIFGRLENSMSKKGLKAMKASAIDFFLKDIETLKQFIKKMHEDFGQNNLDFALKMFVLSGNKVFDMAVHMKEQSRLAEEYVKSLNENFTQEERRAALTHWIENNAALYRKDIIFKQICCIDKMSKEIVPVIARAIKA